MSEPIAINTKDDLIKFIMGALPPVFEEVSLIRGNTIRCLRSAHGIGEEDQMIAGMTTDILTQMVTQMEKEKNNG